LNSLHEQLGLFLESAVRAKTKVHFSAERVGSYVIGKSRITS